jgi:hypothetical protein
MEQHLQLHWLISNYDCYKDKFIVSNIVYASDVERIVDIDNIRPYLFPLSSMTEEQKDIFGKLWWNTHGVNMAMHAIDYLNKNHFDYRGLIEKGLAIDATGLDIY